LVLSSWCLVRRCLHCEAMRWFFGPKALDLPSPGWRPGKLRPPRVFRANGPTVCDGLVGRLTSRTIRTIPDILLIDLESNRIVTHATNGRAVGPLKNCWAENLGLQPRLGKRKPVGPENRDADVCIARRCVGFWANGLRFA
jgi:hypothetical protein